LAHYGSIPNIVFKHKTAATKTTVSDGQKILTLQEIYKQAIVIHALQVDTHLMRNGCVCNCDRPDFPGLLNRNDCCLLFWKKQEFSIHMQLYMGKTKPLAVCEKW